MNTVLAQRNSWICSVYSYSYRMSNCTVHYSTCVTAVVVQCSEQNNCGKGCHLHRNDGVRVMSETARTWSLSRTRTQPFAPIQSGSWAHSWIGHCLFRPVSAIAICGSFEGSFSLCRWWAVHSLFAACASPRTFYYVYLLCTNYAAQRWPAGPQMTNNVLQVVLWADAELFLL